jgi:hypothetical protein
LEFNNKAWEGIDGNLFDGSVQHRESQWDEKNFLSCHHFKRYFASKILREF